MQKKRKVSEAEEEEKDKQRFAFKILKALFTPGLTVFCVFGD